MASTKTTAKTPNVITVKGVSLAEGRVVNIKFIQRDDAETGSPIYVARTRKMPKIVVRRVNSKTVVGHIIGQRDKPIVSASSERAAFSALVDKVWLGKKGKQTWLSTLPEAPL